MMTSTRTAGIILLLALLALPPVVSAQGSGAPVTPQPTISEQFENGFLQMAIKFWRPKLDHYKTEIDRMLSASDLVEVNELRAHAALLLDRVRAREQKRKERARDEERMYASDTATVGSMDMLESRRRTSIDLNAVPPSYQESDEETITRMEAESTVEYDPKRRHAMQLEADLRQLEQLVAVDEDTVVQENEPPYRHDGRLQEALEELEIVTGTRKIQYVTQWIARNYRPGMEKLIEKVFLDMDEFFEAERSYTRDFVNARGRDILSDRWLVDRMLRSLRSIMEIRNVKTESGHGSRMTKFDLEAILMVYNGQDLREFMMIDGGPIPSGTIEKLLR